MKKISRLFFVLGLVALLLPGAAFARQEGQMLQLSLIRNFGYGGMGKIQGNFTLRIVDPPSDLKEVSFYMDGEQLGTAVEDPFLVKFHTSDFPDGQHQMSASGVLADGSVLGSNAISKVFLSSDQAWSETQQVIVPLLVGVGAVTLIGVGLPVLLGKKRKHVPGKYGLAGGAVCPRCGLPFSRPYLAPNLLVGKLVRCPHCGKVSVLPQAPAAILQDAETRYTGAENAGIQPRDAGDINKMIEDSRFED